jgi:hypothetical protein
VLPKSSQHAVANYIHTCGELDEFVSAVGHTYAMSAGANCCTPHAKEQSHPSTDPSLLSNVLAAVLTIHSWRSTGQEQQQQPPVAVKDAAPWCLACEGATLQLWAYPTAG